MKTTTKKFIPLILVMTMMSALIGCGGDDKGNGSGKEEGPNKQNAKSEISNIIDEIAVYKYYEYEENEVINPLQKLPYTGEKAQAYPWNFTTYQYKESIVNAEKYPESYWTPNRQLEDIADLYHVSLHGVGNYGSEVWSLGLDDKIYGAQFAGAVGLDVRFRNDEVSMGSSIDGSDFVLFSSKDDIYRVSEEGYGEWQGYVVNDEYPLEVIPSLLGVEAEDMKVTTFKEAYESGMWIYSPKFVNPAYLGVYTDDDYSNDETLDIIKDTLSENGLGTPTYVYVEDISDEYNTLDDIQRALLVYDTEDSVDYMIYVWYSMSPAISEDLNRIYASDIIFWGSGFEIDDIVQYFNVEDSTRYFMVGLDDYMDPALTPDKNVNRD